ncbi:transmembrane protein 132D [Osmerus mordax]|uniref:transmembrane protein 132D n=1 Tax=Osmerus mordax TaxID=8014 RepID=UPI003510051E
MAATLRRAHSFVTRRRSASDAGREGDWAIRLCLSRSERDMSVGHRLSALLESGRRAQSRTECQVLEDTRNLGPVPLYPTVGFQVLNVDHLLLRDNSQGLLGNSSLQAQRQAFLVTSSGAGLLPPAVNASYGPLTAHRNIPTDLLLSGRRILPVLLARQVRSSAPIVRILFHLPTGRDIGGAVRAEEEEQRGGGRKGGAAGVDGAYCVTAYAFWQTREVRGACLVSPRGFCVAQLKPEPAWFSPASRSASSRERGVGEAQGNPVEVYFQSRKDQTGQCVPQDSLQRVGLGRGVPQGSGTPMRRIGSVNLLKAPPGNPTFFRLRLGGAVVVQTSSKPLKTTDVATFYVFLSSASAIESFTLRATVRKGLSFSRARPSDSSLWDIVLEPGKGAALNTISVVCLRKVAITGKRGLLEVLQLDFETKDLTDQSESQVITWRLELPGNVKDVGIMKIYTTQKDYIGLAPMVMSGDLLNTAVLTGKMASVPVKILAVEAGGSVTDVTNYTSCATTQEDILKVSERCDYVYVNGKETRGRMKMLLNFTYSYLSAQLEMSVWMPRLPLLIDVGDPELSQIKGWRVPVAAGSRRATWDSEEEEEMRKGRGCMLQYQHTVLRVLTPFVAESSDPVAGALPGGAAPPEYFLGPDWQVDVTRQVQYSLRVTDPAVARLQAGPVLQGRAMGITTIQVLSPLSASVLAERKIKVLDDKVSVTELGVQLVSGLSLSLQLSPGSNRAIVATATTQEVMTSPKQEAMVSCWVRFSDGSVAPLDLFDRAGYSLVVTSSDESVVAVRRTPQSAFVVANGEGRGLLVRAELRIGEECQKSKRKSKLAVGAGVLRVDFQNSRKADGGDADGGDTAYGGEVSEEEPRGVTPATPRARTDPGVDRRLFRSTVSETSTLTTRPAQQELAGAGTSVASSTTTTSAPRVPTGKPGTAKPLVTSRPPGTGRPGVDRTTGKGNGQRRDWANMLDNPNPLPKKELPKPDLAPKKEQPKPKPPLVVESDLVRTFRSMTDVEIGIYALVGVSCVAIFAFLLNCASYRLCFRGHKTPVQAPDPRDPKDHKHDWVWLGSTSGQAQCNPPQASTLKRESHLSVESHRSIDGHRGLEASLSTVSTVPERTATLGRRTSSQTPLGMDPMATRSATLLAKPQRNEPLHSPTSKRNQVQFTTFTTLDIKHLAALKKNGVDFNWASQAQAQEEPPQHLPDMPWPVVKPLGGLQ